METNLDVSAELRDLAKKENVFGRLAASFLLELADRLDDERHQRETEDTIADKETDDLRAEVARLTAALEHQTEQVALWHRRFKDCEFDAMQERVSAAALRQPAPAPAKGQE